MGKPQKTEEVEIKIKEMKAEGKTLTEISKKLGRSIYFVYSRLNEKYKPENYEEEYIKSKVIPYLRSRNFKEICYLEGKFFTINEPFSWDKSIKKNFRGDILAIKGDVFHIFEVKKSAQKSLICFAIGEIILGRKDNKKIKGKKKYHIIIPKPKIKTIEKQIKKDSNFLKKEYNLDILFV